MNKIKRLVIVLTDRIEELIDKVIDRDDLFLVDIAVSGNEDSRKIIIYLDGDNGISITDCTKISRQISHQLEEENMISDNLVLEVSSHGLDRPLKLQRQYKKNIGRVLSVQLTDGSNLEGKLISLDKEIIELEIEKKRKSGKIKTFEKVTLPVEKIRQAKVTPSI